METIGNITDEAVPKYIKGKQKNQGKRFKKYRFIADQYKGFRHRPLEGLS